eukprot:Nk52_evm14s250 gene=Nk52_evmTU14s250
MSANEESNISITTDSLAKESVQGVEGSLKLSPRKLEGLSGPSPQDQGYLVRDRDSGCGDSISHSRQGSECTRVTTFSEQSYPDQRNDPKKLLDPSKLEPVESDIPFEDLDAAQQENEVGDLAVDIEQEEGQCVDDADACALNSRADGKKREAKEEDTSDIEVAVGDIHLEVASPDIEILDPSVEEVNFDDDDDPDMKKEKADGERVTSEKRKRYGRYATWFCFGFVGVFLLFMTVYTIVFVPKPDDDDGDCVINPNTKEEECEEGERLGTTFWINNLIKYVVIGICQYGAGLLHLKLEWRVNYTRKLVHFAFFGVPTLLDKVILPYDFSVITGLWNVLIIMIAMLMVSKPIRSRVRIFRVMWAAVDRPEDRPDTLVWLATQTLTGLAVLIPFAIFFADWDNSDWVFILILTNAVGDGLAEPVGIRFGKHKYKVRSLYCGDKRKYVRSFEGSLCVYLVTAISIAGFVTSFDSTTQFAVTLCIMPFLMTVTEALSPHTWDTPFLFGVGGLYLTIMHFSLGD